MTKKKWLVFILVLLVLSMSFIVLNRDRFFGKKSSNPYEISVITRGKSTESWTTIKQGIDQAAKDLNVEVSFVTLSGENNGQEQVSLMQREITNGANAVVIAPVNSDTLKEAIEDARKSVPVIAMQSTVDSIEDLPRVSCDNRQLGVSIAKKLISNEKTFSGKIVILRSSMAASNIEQRYQGIMSVLGQSNPLVRYLDVPDDPQLSYDEVKRFLRQDSADVLVALDGATLESAGKAKRDSQKSGGVQPKIYGIGRTNAVVSLLETEVINSIGVENEYNMGYLSVRSALDHINKKNESGNALINFAIVDHQNMYNSDNQRLLFPFVG